MWTDDTFDNDEYWLQADPADVPDAVRPLFDVVWIADDGPPPDDHPDPVLVGLAMAEIMTGLSNESEQIAELSESEFFGAPDLVYP